MTQRINLNSTKEEVMQAVLLDGSALYYASARGYSKADIKVCLRLM